MSPRTTSRPAPPFQGQRWQRRIHRNKAGAQIPEHRGDVIHEGGDHSDGHTAGTTEGFMPGLLRAGSSPRVLRGWPRGDGSGWGRTVPAPSWETETPSFIPRGIISAVSLVSFSALGTTV